MNEYTLSINDIKNYKTPFVRYDHGFVSATILFQNLAYTNHIIEMCNNVNTDISFAWNDLAFTNFNNEKTIDIFANSLFSILVHNIYTKRSKEEFGLEYVHNLDINPFSYFCSFCDTLQKWNRPKQIDSSKRNLPEAHFLDDHFDIYIEDEKIILKCSIENVSIIKERLKDESTFLFGIEGLIEIHEF